MVNYFKGKSRVVKSVNFYPAEEELLDWSLRRPEKFSDFVKVCLLQAQRLEQAPPSEANAAAIERVIERVIKRELAGLAIISEDHPPSEANAASVPSELERNLAALFI